MFSSRTKNVKIDMLTEKINEILNLDWIQEEKDLISKTLAHIQSYKYFMPTEMENDFVALLSLTLREKKYLMEQLKAKQNKQKVVSDKETQTH